MAIKPRTEWLQEVLHRVWTEGNYVTMELRVWEGVGKDESHP